MYSLPQIKLFNKRNLENCQWVRMKTVYHTTSYNYLGKNKINSITKIKLPQKYQITHLFRWFFFLSFPKFWFKSYEYLHMILLKYQNIEPRFSSFKSNCRLFELEISIKIECSFLILQQLIRNTYYRHQLFHPNQKLYTHPCIM